MGLILDARCDSCGFAREGLRVGATTAQMSGERRSALHLFVCHACRDVATLELFLGEPRTELPCDRCRAAFVPVREKELRVVTMSGERLTGHTCPACGSAALGLKTTGKFL